MAHVGKEHRLRLACLLSRLQCLAQRLLLRQCFPGLCVHVREARAYAVHKVVFPVLRMADARKAYGLIRFLSIHIDQIAERDDPLAAKPLADGFGLYELDELIAILLRDIELAVAREAP